MKNTLRNFFYQKTTICDILHIIIILLSIFLVISISIDTFKNIPFQTQGSYLKIQLWICIFFLFDFLFEFILSDRKWYFLRTHFIFLLISIPYLNIIDYYDLSFSPGVSYFIRFIPLIRGGYALAIVVSWLTKNKISGLFVSYLTMLLATVYFSSLIFLVVEHKVNPLVTNYPDSLWWAFMNVTTVGSNIYAVTTGGRILTVVLAALGMMMFPIFTVYITSIMQRVNRKKKGLYHSKNQKETEINEIVKS
ncbi:ion channel [Dysgonomonas alginatilytica]|uniref:Ion channel n=1 Tax=Dysgonomonas alginatilytica TaxID=1605892 RepID=A0A2V3PQ08_9BACT|nr:potassium channel family protein [Dysgonomonas alginatilytica]PXV65018.1 ion channel [Dysgonomonas alginatilytica]